MDSRRNLKKYMAVAALLVVGSWVYGGAAYGQPWDGNGVEGDPYQIWDANDMQAIGADSNYWDAHFLLCADIDLGGYTGTEFNIIGYSWDKAFTGVFDGNGHVISNFTYSGDERRFVGVFGYLRGKNAEIRHLGLIDPNTDAGAKTCVGSLVGWLRDGGMVDCYAEGGSVRGNIWVGGLVGCNGGWIEGAYAKAIVKGSEQVGGLVGYSYGSIMNCYAIGEIEGVDIVGGLTGDNKGSVIMSYAAALVFGITRVGGLVGEGEGTVFNSFWDIESSGEPNSDGGKGKTTAEMQTGETFIGWSCDGAWRIDEGNDYPHLWWEDGPGEVIGENLSDFVAGSGEPNDPYLIYTAEELNFIGLFPCEWNNHFKLMADIDLSEFEGTEFNIIGIGAGVPYPGTIGAGATAFTGIFDGDGHTISNLTYTAPESHYIGLFAYVAGPDSEIRNLGLIEPNIAGGDNVAALVSFLKNGRIIDCSVDGGNVSGDNFIGGLIGQKVFGETSTCHTSDDVLGFYEVGGLVGMNYGGSITKCSATGNIMGSIDVGGLAGKNDDGGITWCSALGNVSGGRSVGGLIGLNGYCKVSDCYAKGDVLGRDFIGGLVGVSYKSDVLNCYSVGRVAGEYCVGGLVGSGGTGPYTNCFWDSDINPDINGIGNTTDPNVTGESTANMQTGSTFTDAGWDFNTPIWTICEGLEYPRLWWEFGAPVLESEPDMTIGTSNTIFWWPAADANDYLAECAEDANFVSVVQSSGWIADTNYTFVGLEVGRRYWYSVKARRACGVESMWSNVESSVQVTLGEAVETVLDTNSLKSENMMSALLNKIDVAQAMIEDGQYRAALNKLEKDILVKTDGCDESGEPDKSDWIITCEEQDEVYPLIIETIEYVMSLME